MADENRTSPANGEPSLHDVTADDRTVVDGMDAISNENGTAFATEGGTDANYPKIDGFEILGPLGEGGMGTVWKAIQLSVDREVALKLTASRVFTSKMAETRFQREVKLAGKLEHPNIAQIYEAGLCKDIHYYAMRLVRGVPLDQYVARNELRVADILRLMHKVCDAVGHAHEMGILHRDIKPGNVIVDQNGQPFVLDFGLAKAIDDDSRADHTTTREGSVVGTPAFMAPEQAKGKTSEIDTRTDVYALGVMLYVLLTGEHPTDLTGSRFEVLVRIADGQVKPIGEAGMTTTATGESIPPQLESLVMKALSKERDDRYPDGDALAQAIKEYLAAPPTDLAAVATDPAVGAVDESVEKVLREPNVGGSFEPTVVVRDNQDADVARSSVAFKKRLTIALGTMGLGLLTLVAIGLTIRFVVFWLFEANHPTDVKEGILGTFIFLPIAIALAFATWKLARLNPEKPRDVRCPECGYNMYGLAEARCPECGAMFTLDQLR